MSENAPDLIALEPDEHLAQYVARTADGRQFFVTTHVYPECPIHGHAFVAAHVFDVTGKLVDARIDDIGVRALLGESEWSDAADRSFSELGWTIPHRIVMAPFEAERFGTKFGLLLRSKAGGEICLA